MTSLTTLAPIVTGIIGILGTLIKIYAVYDTPPKGKRSVSGSWRGQTDQRVGPSGVPIEVDLVIDISTFWKRIWGTSRVKGGGTELNVKVAGGFEDSDHLILRWTSKDGHVKNFGYLLLKLDASGTTLEGEMIGYGHKSQKIISGVVKLVKV